MVLLVAVLIVTLSSTSMVCAQDAPRTIEITAQRFHFTPGEITLKKGQPMVLALKCLDVAHGLRIRELGVLIKGKAGRTTEARFTPEKTGDFIGHCALFCGRGHGSMKMKVHVVN